MEDTWKLCCGYIPWWMMTHLSFMLDRSQLAKMHHLPLVFTLFIVKTIPLVFTLLIVHFNVAIGNC